MIWVCDFALALVDFYVGIEEGGGADSWGALRFCPLFFLSVILVSRALVSELLLEAGLIFLFSFLLLWHRPSYG